MQIHLSEKTIKILIFAKLKKDNSCNKKEFETTIFSKTIT